MRLRVSDAPGLKSLKRLSNFGRDQGRSAQAATSTSSPLPVYQTETALLKQVISSLRAEKYNEAIENVLLIAKCQNKNLDVKKEILLVQLGYAGFRAFYLTK